jgi:O-antigen ligase
MTLGTPRLSLRALIAVLAAGAAVLSATGIVQIMAFHQPSTLKYALTIAAPLLALAACTTERPLRVVTGVAIIAAPFVSATTSFASTRVSVLTPLLIVGIALVVASAPRGDRPASLGLAGVLAFPLLAVPLLIGSSNRSFVVSLALILAMAWLVYRTAEEPGGMRAVLAAVAVSAAIQGAIAVWQSTTGHQLNLYGGAGTSQFSASYIFTYGSALRPTGGFTDPVSFGDVMAISVPLIAAFGIEARDWRRRLLLLAVAALTGTALALSLSRAGWVGAVAGLVLMVVLLPRPIRKRAAPVLLAGVLAIAGIGLAVAGSAVRGRFASIVNPTAVQGQTAAQKGVAQGDQNRLHYWSLAFDGAFLGHPLAGIGVGNMPRFLLQHESRTQAGLGNARAAANTSAILATESASSTFLQLLGEGGVFALVLLILLLRGMFRDGRDGLRAYPVLGAGLAGGALALVTGWITDYTIQGEPVAASVGILFGALAAAGRSGRISKVQGD